MAQCRAMTAAGERCKGKAMKGGLCVIHARQEAKGEEVQSFFEEPKKEKKSPTKPWNAADNPWVPDIFKTSKKHKGFRPRFIEPNNLERRLNEGWAVADAREWVNEETLKKDEEGAIDTTLRRRGMILMEMPEELVEQRDAYFKHKTDLQDASKVKVAQYKKLKKEEQESGYDTGLQLVE